MTAVVADDISLASGRGVLADVICARSYRRRLLGGERWPHHIGA